MVVSLEVIRLKLTARMRTLDYAFDRHAHSPVCKRKIDRFSLQAGLVLSLWQIWCVFCRETLIGSAHGIATKSGHATSRYAGMSEMEIAYVARELAHGRTVRKVKTLAGVYLEPTWGDLSKINRIATGIGSTNHEQLADAFGAGIAILDLQRVRNASAHINRDTIGEVKAARVRYAGTVFAHPSDMMFWIDPSSNDYLWKTWIEEMDVISELAIA